MKTNTHTISLMALGILMSAGCQNSAQEQTSADLILENGRIYTVDKSNAWAEAVAIDDGRIVYVGSTDGAAKYKDSDTKSINLDGKMVMPGIIDTHIHALGVVKADACDLDTQAYTLEEMVPVLKDCLVKYDIKPGERMSVLQWAFSGGNQPSAKYPTIRAALDAVATDREVILSGDDGHHSAYNSYALSQARDRDGNITPINKETMWS